MVKEKKILTPIGELKLKQSIYRRDIGGSVHIPLDNQLCMRGENMTKDIQEAILYSCAHNTPEEAESYVLMNFMHLP